MGFEFVICGSLGRQDILRSAFTVLGCFSFVLYVVFIQFKLWISLNSEKLWPTITKNCSPRSKIWFFNFELNRSSDANSAEQMLGIKRLKRDAPPSFNKKSNEDQYKATKCVFAVKDTSSMLERKDLPKTKEHLEKGMLLLKECQKLAGKSLYGWKTVLEYKHHDLAEDDEDL